MWIISDPAKQEVRAAVYRPYPRARKAPAIFSLANALIIFRSFSVLILKIIADAICSDHPGKMGDAITQNAISFAQQRK